MKSTVASPQSTKPSKQDLATEREQFFEKAYLTLLAGALQHFEYRDEFDNLREDGDDEEEEHIACLIDRAYCIAERATARYFEAKEFAAKC
jgi:hypothetical protein